MANRRRLKLDDYGITAKRYKELCGFCEQYPEWRDELKYKKDTVKSVEITDMPRGTDTGDGTGNLAVRREELRRKCELVEQTAIEADPDLYEYIIKSVCYEVPFWYLQDIMGIPSNRTDFMAVRRYFFHLLSNKKMLP